MFKIIVPLDGTSFAERALPLALSMAQRLGAELILLLTTGDEQKEYILAGPHQELIILNEDYLAKVKASLLDPGLPGHLPPERVRCEVEKMNPELAIGEVTPAFGGDLVVMATHARKGLYLLLKGSVAQKVLSQGSIAVVLLRPQEDIAEVPLPELLRSTGPTIPATGPVRLLVTLDGSPEAENILGPVSVFARQLEATLYLEMVYPSSYSYEESGFSNTPTTLTQKNHQTRQHALAYLKVVQQWLKTQGLEAVVEVRSGDVVDQIYKYSDEIDADLPALATHARGPLGQLILGSVATDVLRKCSRPVLLVNNTIWAREMMETDFHYNFKPEPVP